MAARLETQGAGELGVVGNEARCASPPRRLLYSPPVEERLHWKRRESADQVVAHFEIHRYRPADVRGDFWSRNLDRPDRPAALGVARLGCDRRGDTAHVAGRAIFYNNGYWDNSVNGFTDDNAIDTSKTALLPGQTASFG